MANPLIVDSIQIAGKTFVSKNTIGLPFGAVLPNAKYVGTAGVTVNASGHNTVYTVPANRRALILPGGVVNTTVNATTVYLEIQKGGSGSYYWINASGSPSTSQIFLPFFGSPFVWPIVLEAGDVFSVNLSGANLCLYYGDIIEFDSNANFKSIWILNPAGGGSPNAIYTVPAGKSAQILNSYVFNETTSANANAYGSAMTLFNSSGSNVTFQLGCIPSGGSQQQITPNIPVSTISAGTNPQTATNVGKLTLNAGDALTVAATYAGATSPFWGWLNVIEM